VNQPFILTGERVGASAPLVAAPLLANGQSFVLLMQVDAGEVAEDLPQIAM